jgi:hypothetical protein
MAQSKQSKRKSRLGHWVRVVVSFLSFGFIFPHSLTEDEDTDNAKSDGRNEAIPKKQQPFGEPAGAAPESYHFFI